MDTCAGIKSSGHWKGYPCNAVAKHLGLDGKSYCANHLVVANEAERSKRKNKTGETHAGKSSA